MSRSCLGRATPPSASSSTRRSSRTSATPRCCTCSDSNGDSCAFGPAKAGTRRPNAAPERLRGPRLRGMNGDNERVEREKRREATMTMKSTGLLTAFACVLLASTSALAAEVTPDRLVNADNEPHNWLMNHRTYDGQRYSPLARIDRSNVKGLKLAYAVPLGGAAGNEWVQATP